MDVEFQRQIMLCSLRTKYWVLTAACKSLCTGPVQPPQLRPGVNVELYTNKWIKKEGIMFWKILGAGKQVYTLIMLEEAVWFQTGSFFSIFLQ